MDKYRVKINPRAYYDIEGIFRYIAVEKLSPENARAQTDRIYKGLKSLELFPKAHQIRMEGRYANKKYRQLVIDNYLVIYRIDEKRKEVIIVTVQYQGRNL